MKTGFILAIALLVGGWQTASADNDRPISVDRLPARAATFLSEQFPNDAVAFAKEERELFETRYEVVLASSVRIEFLGNGEWEEIDCRYQSVPEAVIPTAIREQLAQRYPDQQVREIKRERGRHEVTLSRGLELTFDRRNVLIDIDD